MLNSNKDLNPAKSSACDKLLATIRQNLAAEPRKHPVSDSLTPAAVLFPLLYKDDEPNILLTRRTQMVKAHKGQVSFPGGVRDVADKSLLVTALREAEEEIGLQPNDVEILGSLDPVTTASSGFLVHSFVGLIPYPYPFRLNSREVADILIVPFHFLADAKHWHRNPFISDNEASDDYFVPYGKHLIWGATARILKIFFKRVDLEK
jgi:8-oxo-dGTP pyrophosphatase MutT (NUDIX family)